MQPVIFQYSPYLSSHAQAASAATEPSDMAVVSWRTDFARQSPDENAGADGQAVLARGGGAALVERDEPAENLRYRARPMETKSPDTGRTRRSPPCSTRHRELRPRRSARLSSHRARTPHWPLPRSASTSIASPRKLPRRWMRYTLRQISLSSIASDSALLPPPETATSCPAKNAPSHTLQ